MKKNPRLAKIGTRSLLFALLLMTLPWGVVEVRGEEALLIVDIGTEEQNPSEAIPFLVAQAGSSATEVTAETRFLEAFPRGVIWAGLFPGIEPGKSTKDVVDSVLGPPLTQVPGRSRYEYGGPPYLFKTISVEYDPQTWVVKSIDIHLTPETDKDLYEDLFGLGTPTSTRRDERGNLIEYYLPQAVTLHYSGPNDTYPVEYFTQTPIETEIKKGVRVLTAKPTLTASPSQVGPGDTVSLRFREAPGNLQDWVTLVPAQAPDKYYGEFYFLGGKRDGEFSFSAPDEGGEWQFRLFADWPVGGYEVIATSNVIRVGGDAPVEGGDGEALLDDDFDSEHRGEGQLNYSQFVNWDVTEGTVDLIGHGFYDFFPDHGLYLDLDGSTNNAGRLESKTHFSLESGEYRLEFALAGSPLSGPNTVTVSLGDLYSEDFTLAVKEPFRTIARTVRVSTPTGAKLTFDHSGGDNQGLLVDEVKLTKVSGEILEEEEGVLDLSEAPEEWAREWTVLSTIRDFSGGGKAGFYEEAIRSGHANPNPGREGILYLHPISTEEPARLSRRITLTGPSPTLSIGVSGNRDVDGDFALVVKVNGEPLGEEKIIAGAQGWQDQTFDLSAYSGKTVTIEIEARANNWHYEYAFFDYIRVDEGSVGPLPTPYKDAFRLSTGELIMGELLSFDGSSFRIKTEKGVIDKKREEIATILVGIAQ